MSKEPETTENQKLEVPKESEIIEKQKKQKERKKKPKKVRVQVAYGSYTWHEGKRHRTAHEGTVISFPENSSALKQGLKSKKFKKV